MSRNSKNVRKLKEAARITELHKKGGKGPAKTTKVNTKKRAWYQLKDANGRLLSKRDKKQGADVAAL